MENDRFDLSSENELAPSAMYDWFCVSGTNEIGPFSQEHLWELLASGEIGPDTMVRTRAGMEWQKAASINLLTIAPRPPDSACAKEEAAGKTDPAVLPSSQRKPRRRALVVASIVAAVLVAVVALERGPGAGSGLRCVLCLAKYTT
jgi:hypothetical protein